MPSSDIALNERLASVGGVRDRLDECGPPSRAAHRFGEASGYHGESIGRYTLHTRIAAGGMGSVYLGSLAGAADFSRVVAVKRMHPQIAADPTFAARFRD